MNGACPGPRGLRGRPRPAGQTNQAGQLGHPKVTNTSGVSQWSWPKAEQWIPRYAKNIENPCENDGFQTNLRFV